MELMFSFPSIPSAKLVLGNISDLLAKLIDYCIM